MPAGLQPVDCCLQVGDVAVDIEMPRLGHAFGFIEPASLVRIGVGQAGLAGKQRIAVDEAAFDDRKQVADRLETLDCSEPTAGADGSTRFDIEHHFDKFPEHAGGKLREADPPETVRPCRCGGPDHASLAWLGCWQEPEVRRGVAIIDRQSGSEVSVPETNGLHGCCWCA